LQHELNSFALAEKEAISTATVLNGEKVNDPRCSRIFENIGSFLAMREMVHAFSDHPCPIFTITTALAQEAIL
jgi:hypothetical protein